MIHSNSLLRRFVAVLLGLVLMAGIGRAQISGNSGAQDGWNYTGTSLSFPNPTREHRGLAVTFTDVYVGAYDVSGYWNIERYNKLTQAFVGKWSRDFNTINGICSDSLGRVYVFDGYQGKGYRYNPDGSGEMAFGIGNGSGDGQFSANRGEVYFALAVDSQFQIYVADCYNYRIQVFNPDGSFKAKFGSSGSLPGQFSNILCNVAIGPQDEVLVIDFNTTITRFTTAGEYVSRAVYNDYYWWNTMFQVTNDGLLMVGTRDWNGWMTSHLLNISTMVSDYHRGGYWINSNYTEYSGLAHFLNTVNVNGNYNRGAGFDRAGNLWMIRYGSLVSGNWTVESYERHFRFDTYKPTTAIPLPTVISAVQQLGKQTVDISYSVKQNFLGGGSLMFGGTINGGTLVGGGTVTTALVGWMGGVKNWSHLVVPSVGAGTYAASGKYFWSDMYDLSTQINSRYPLQDNTHCAAVDASGNVYVATDNCIRKISSSGNITTLAGLAGSNGYVNDTGVTAQFHNPWGICVDLNGNVFVTERDGRVIRKITPAGVVTTLAGSWGGYGSTDGIGQNARFYTLGQITVDASGALYVAEWESGYIRKITQDGSVTTVGQTAQNLEGIAVDGSGNIYATALNGQRIMKVVPNGTPAGIVTTLAGNGTASHLDGNGAAATFYTPRGITAGADGNLYVTEDDGAMIRKITQSGDVTTIGRTGSLVYNLAVDAAGSLYAPGNSSVMGVGGRMVRKGTRSTSTSPGIAVFSGSLGAGVQTGTVQTVSWDVSQDLPGMSFASLAFEVIAKGSGQEIGAHFVTIPSDSASTSDLRISNRPIDESDLGDLWLWLLANRDPRLAISGNSVIMTQAGLDYVSDAPRINGASATDTSVTVHTGGSGGADNNWANWGTTTDRGRAFAYKFLNYRPVTASEITRANAGRYNLNSVNNYSAVNLAP